jgi:uncharacterized protein YbjT (DUF2867 family)
MTKTVKKTKVRNKNERINTILVLGASGYVGARLVPELLKQGYRVRAGGRSLKKLKKRPWSGNPDVELIEFDVFNTDSLIEACKGTDAAYYLIHSMNPDGKEFMQADRDAANNMVKAAEQAGLKRIVYLGGLGEKGPELSKHLLSRIEVGEILQSGSVPTTVLRAAMIIGAGSASFEILRYLVERLPIMITPKWVRIVSQPIAIENVLNYMVGCLENPETEGGTFDIGGPEVLSYHSLMRLYTEEAGLNKRWIIPVPVLTPRLSSYWIHLVTPVNAAIARPLAEGLSSQVVCTDDRITKLIPQQLLDCRTAIRAALDQAQHNLLRDVDEENDASVPPPEWSYPGDDSWAGGKVYEDHRRVSIDAEPEEIWKHLLRIGGENGWYYADSLWQLRGLIDKMLGGVGMRQGRTDPENLNDGDIIDFWRIHKVVPNRRLLLIAEMKVPGSAILDFSIIKTGESCSELHQVARFIPRGLSGIIYWNFISPLHNLIFNGMLGRIAKSVQKPVTEGPELVKHES